MTRWLISRQRCDNRPVTGIRVFHTVSSQEVRDILTWWRTAALLAMSLSLHSSKGSVPPSRRLGDVRGSNPVRDSRHHDKKTNLCLPLLGYENNAVTIGKKFTLT